MASINFSIKEKIQKEYYRRVRIVLKSENAANKFEAIDTLAIPVVTYCFNINQLESM